MRKAILKHTAIFGLVAMLFSSCQPKENPPLVWFPDMYFPVAYDPLQKAEDAYPKHENEIPLFVQNNGATGLVPVDGTVPRNGDALVEVNISGRLDMPKYLKGYEASKSITTSPLHNANFEKDLARGKVLFERTCGACHGVNGDGNGPIVESGAYVGVPNFKDRELTIGTVHYVITNGRNAMGSYAGQLQPADRWRVAMYVMQNFKGRISPAPAVTIVSKDSAVSK